MPNADEQLALQQQVIRDAASEAARAAVSAVPGILPQSEMSRLVVFRGNNKDTVTAEAWTEMVDRHITVLKWSQEQTAGAAIESMRDDANIWRENLSNSSDPDKKAMLQDWTALRKAFLTRFGKAKTRAARVQGLGQLKQAPNETCGGYQDRVIHALNKLTSKTAGEEMSAPEKRGFTKCRDLFETAIFLNGLRSDIRTYVELELRDDTTTDKIYETARHTEIALSSKKEQHKVAKLDVEDKYEKLKTELAEIKKTLSSGGDEVVAAVDKKKKDKKKANGKAMKATPMGARSAMLCWRCKQWGKHMQSECRLTPDQINTLTPMTKDDKPTGEVFDSQYPNA